MSMDPTTYRERCSRRGRSQPDPMEAMTLYALGLTGEAGEVADEMKKVLFHGKPLDRDKLVNELGDVLWYLDRFLNRLDVTLGECMEANDAKLEKRYPADAGGFDAAAKRFGFSAEEGA